MTAEGAPTPSAEPGSFACPRCGASVGARQDWCLECGLPARTVVAPTPAWRAPIAILATVAALALAAMAVAFVDLTADPEPPQATAPPPPAATDTTTLPADPTQTEPPEAETVTTPGSTTPITEPGEVTVPREDEPPATVTAPPADPEAPQP